MTKLYLALEKLSTGARHPGHHWLGDLHADGSMGVAMKGAPFLLRHP